MYCPTEWKNMESLKKHGNKKKLTISYDSLFIVWIPILFITLAHYFVPPHLHWIHDVLRRLYYLPLIYCSIKYGLKWGLFTTLIITITYLPHAFMNISHFDPAKGIEKVLEIILYFGVALIGGYLSDEEKKQRKALKKALNYQKNLMDQLVRAGRLSALGEVVAGIAHEIKNPLHSLLGTAEIIDPVIPKDSDERKMWENHVEELKRLNRTSNRFLSFSSPSKSKKEKINLIEVAERLIELISADCRKRGVNIIKKFENKNFKITGDLDQLAQIVINIALNGLKAMEKKGDTLTIDIKQGKNEKKNYYGFIISNNGPQIPQNEIETIFDPFHSESKSTGLGLSISSRLAKQHGGFIECKNIDEKVVFTLYLPQINIDNEKT
jgi:signal transduction histidine kinase